LAAAGVEPEEAVQTMLLKTAALALAGMLMQLLIFPKVRILFQQLVVEVTDQMAVTQLHLAIEHMAVVTAAPLILVLVPAVVVVVVLLNVLVVTDHQYNPIPHRAIMVINRLMETTGRAVRMVAVVAQALLPVVVTAGQEDNG
jgi:hypothetical protein